MPRLEKWGAARTSDYDPYLPPECSTWILSGEVYANPRFPDGDRIITSKIVEFMVEDDLVTAITASGTVYILGEPDPKFIETLAAKGHTMTQALETLKKIADIQNLAKRLN